MLLGNRIMKHLRCAHLLITLGRDGMALFDRTGGIYHIPTVAREVFDVTGAGDTVIAVLTMALARGATALEAAVIANFAAGVVVGKLGTASCSAEELAIAYGRDASSSQLERYR